MKGWAGPLLLFVDLGALALAFLVVVGLVGFVGWLAAQPWAWLLLVGFLPALLAGASLHQQRRRAPASPAADGAPGWQIVPTFAPVQYCDACGSALRGGLCPYCVGYKQQGPLAGTTARSRGKTEG